MIEDQMPAPALKLDNFPDSPYADELRRGAPYGRFADALEAEYTAAHLQRVRLRVRVWFSVIFFVSVLFTLDQIRRDGVLDPYSMLHWAVHLPCIAVLAALPWTRFYQRHYMSAVRILMPVIGILIAIFIALAIADGREESLAALTVILIAVFFFVGLPYRQALPTAILILAAYALTAMAAGVGSTMLIKTLAVLVLTTVIGAVVFRDVEQSYRRSFLETALLGELAAHDALTGLMNRRAFDEHLLRVWQYGLRNHCSIAVLMIDIDYFKQYNDVCGHQGGDAALHRVAQVIKGFARRPLDLAARYGGEEFAVIMYDLALPHVHDTAERLRQAIHNLQIRRPTADGTAVTEVTVSIGVGLAAPTIDRTPAGVVQLADEALYEAKNAGRNCVIVKGIEEHRLLETGAFNSRGK
jgi:diguanylate cyclase (GGDEF)-like protein